MSHIRWNKNYLLAILNSHIVDYPTPVNLTYMWSFGSTAGFCLVIQILTGVFLAMGRVFDFQETLQSYICRCTFISLTQDKSLFNCGESGKAYFINEFLLFLPQKGLIHIKKSCNNCLSRAHSKLTKITTLNIAGVPIRIIHLNFIYRTTHNRGSKLRYATSFRSFSSDRRSDVRVVDDSRVSFKNTKTPPLFLPVLTICKARQAYLKQETDFLFKMFNNKIHRASKKVQEKFTYDCIFHMFTSLDNALKNHYRTGYRKYNIFDLICNPCYLLYCYTQLKHKKINGANNISIGNITLPSIITLSRKLADGTYKPKPLRRIFIAKVNKKMRPLGISSDHDKIVQKAILTFLEPIFEHQFLECSHGYRKKKIVILV
jgi:hypothetical protein